MYDYTKNLRWAELRVGVIVSVAFIIFFMIVIFAGNLKTLISPKATVHAYFSDVRGLRVGAPVWFLGLEIGSVKGISLRRDGTIDVALVIEKEDLRFIKKDSSVTIYTMGLLGDKYVALGPGTESAAGIKSGEGLQGRAEPEFQELVEAGKNAIARLDDLMLRLQHITVMIETGEGSASKFIRDPALYDNLRDSAGRLSSILNSVEKGHGTAGRLITDETLYKELEASARDIKEFAQTLKSSEGSVNLLIRDRSLYDKLLSAANSMDEFSNRLKSSQGTINMLIEDKSLYENMASASEKLNAILSRLEKGEGFVGGLTKDEGVSADLSKTVKELNALLEDIRRNPRRYFKFSVF